jgi:hypothetical protein
MFNTARAASFDRGHETQKGGATAKDILRATSAITITMNDCKVKYGKTVLVTKDILKGLVGRAVIINGKSTILKSKDDVAKYLGKYIEIRSPQYCKEKNGKICKICAGEYLAMNPDGINLAVTNISEVILTASLKKMHNAQVSTVPVDITDVIF